MTHVTEPSQELFTKLVAWELLGVEDDDPKALLRQVPLSDLSLVAKNIQDIPDADQFVSTTMVSLELGYRLGKNTDWSWEREGVTVHLGFKLCQPISFVPMRVYA